VKKLFTFTLLLLVGQRLALAAPELNVRVAPTEISSSESADLIVQVSDSSLPRVEGVKLQGSQDFDIQEVGRSQSMTIVNGDPTSAVTISFKITPKSKLPVGTYKLPGGVVKVGGEQLKFEGVDLVIGNSLKAGQSSVDFVQIVDNLEPYEGEQLLYRCEILTKSEIANAVLEEVTLDGFFRENFPENKQTVRKVQNARVFSIREVVYPNRDGALQIPERGLSAKVRVKSQANTDDLFSDIWSNVFDEFSFKPRRFIAEPLQIKVRPLPPRPGWVQGYVPVGSTKVDVALDRQSLKSGESARLTITFRSEGNLRPLELNLPSPEHLKSYPEKPTIVIETEGDKIIQVKSFIFNLIPEYGGLFQVGAVEIPVFDPVSGEYHSLKSLPKNLVVEGEKIPETESLGNQPAEVAEVQDENLEELYGSDALRSDGLRLSFFNFLYGVTALLTLLLFVLWRKRHHSKGREVSLALSSLLKGDLKNDSKLNLLRTNLQKLQLERAELAEPSLEALAKLDELLYSGKEFDRADLEQLRKKLVAIERRI